MPAPSAAAATNSARSRLDSSQVVRPSETPAHSANPAARTLTKLPCTSPCEIADNIPSIAAMP